MGTLRDQGRLYLAVVVVAGSVGVGFIVPMLDGTEQQVLISAIAAAIVGPLAWSGLRGRLDLLEPLPWALAAMGLMFVVRPVVDATSGYAFRGVLDLRPQFDTALAAGLVATVALLVGYSLPFGARAARSLPGLPASAAPGATVRFGVALLIVAAAMYAVYAVRAGTSVIDLASRGFAASQTVSTAYFYLAPTIAFPALLLLLQSTFTSRVVWPRWIIVILVLGLAALLAPASQRLWLLLLLAPFAIYPMLRAAYRPRLTLVLAAALLVIPALVAMRDLQPGQSVDASIASLGRAASDPIESYRQFAAGPDTEMFDGLALGMQEVPAHLPFQPFSSVISLIAHPIPRELWRDKPTTVDGQVDVMLFPDLESGAASVAHSVVGNFYYDTGMIGVAIGMLVVGWGLRVLYAYFRLHANNDQVRVVYASALPLVIVLFRGNLPDTFARALFTVGPLLLAYAVLRPRPRFVTTWTSQFPTPSHPST
jgi:hypothetical protein